MKKSFSFIVNSVEVQAKLPLQVIPNVTLQRADAEQVATIKEKLRLFGSSWVHDEIYESRIEAGEDDGKQPREMRFTKLPPDSWRYLIVVFSGARKEIRDLEISAALLVNVLRFGFTVTYHDKGEGFAWDPSVMGVYAADWVQLLRSPCGISENDIKLLGEYCQSLQRMKASFPSIYRAAEQLHNLRHIPESCPFLVIGFFSVIEALITHAPTLTEPMDSLTHQMKTKMNLLSKRFERCLNYGSFFGERDTDKLWGRLYAYRSKVAHGDSADFARDFKLLKSPDRVLQFLHETAKLVTLCAMKEPDFITDLKKC